MVDPQKSYHSWAAAMYNSLYSPLLFRLPDMTIAPGLAKTWERVSDTEWTLTLEEGVTFHNGEPFNAEVVKWNVERVVEPGFVDWAFLADPLNRAEVVDEYTVKIVTDGMVPELPSLLCMFLMLPPKYIEEVGRDGFEKAPVGTGPYKFLEWLKDSHLTVEANPDYWESLRAPNWDRVIFRVLPEAGTRAAALRAGEVDIIGKLPSDDVESVDADPTLDAVWIRSLRTVFVRFFPESPQGGGEPFEDIRVREAVNRAINVDAMIEFLFGGRAFRTATLITPDFPGYDPSIQPYEYDPEKAKELLAEAGYADGFSIDLNTFAPGSSTAKSLDLAQVIAEDLAKVGITVNVIPLEMGNALTAQFDRTLVPLNVWSWGGGDLSCRSKYWNIFHTDSNARFLTDDEVVALIDEMDATGDPARFDQLCGEIAKRVHEQSLLVTLWAQPDLYAKRADLDWQPRADELIFPWEVTPKP